MNITAEQKKFFFGIATGIVSTLIGGVILFHYEHFFLTCNTSYASPTKSSFWKDSRKIMVKPVSKWSRFVLFAPKHYYKNFDIKFYGGDLGFSPNTAVIISATTGKLLQLSCAEGIKPTFADGLSANNWFDSEYRSNNKTVFVSGPNPRIEAGMQVVVISKGKDVPDDTLKLIVSPPGENPVDVDYITNVTWPASK